MVCDTCIAVFSEVDSTYFSGLFERVGRWLLGLAGMGIWGMEYGIWGW